MEGSQFCQEGVEPIGYGMTTWYRTRWHDTSSTLCGPEIREVQVTKSSEVSVWIDGRRFAKRSGFENFFTSREEALGFIRAAQQSEVEYHQRLIQAHQKILDSSHELPLAHRKPETL